MISVPKGTSTDIVVSLKDGDGSQYQLKDGEKLILSVKSSIYSNAYLLSKTITKEAYNSSLEGYVFEIEVSDTANLDFGKYLYDIALQTASEFFIVCPCDVFEVADVVSRRVS